jgi:eukaryotic-like serine/threonine-protein kinase
MDGSMPTSTGHRPARTSERVDALCDQFEAVWRNGPAPRIEDYLPEVETVERAALLRELVALERELRRKRGERPDAQEYCDRFPEYDGAVRAAFATAQGPGGGLVTRPKSETGCNLLFGVLALQNNFISRDDLVATFAVWVADKGRPLAQILVDRGALDGSRRGLLEALVAEHLKQHGGDTEASLAAVNSLASVRDDLGQLGDPELQASVAATASRRSADADATANYAASSRRAGERFRILRFHREGGLGRVYVARDEELGRVVALKEIRPDKVAEADLRGRFVLEAEINGGLEHPGIVPVYSLGTYEDGRPFYAMRFVDGDSFKEAIESYHKDHPATDPSAVEFRKLLGRFIDVCEAIAFAHSKGVLHRDLKPHNVMLGRFGETLLIDWGLSKATGRREPVGPNATCEATLVPPSGSGHAPTLGVLGSPPYMSPEQASGEVESLGPAADVYGLGAILFALLTGEPPLEGGAVGEVLDRARRGAIRAPRSLNPRIPRALEAVCLKALAFKPVDRYPTATALVEDVEHWLADEPVSAWREPWGVRLSRWGRHHRPLVTGLGVALLVASASISVAAFLLSRERDRAVENLRESRRVVGAMFEKVVPKLTDQKDMDVTQRDILESALRFYEGFVLSRDQDPAVRHEVSRAYHQVGNIKKRLDRIAEAETAYSRAVAMLDTLVAGHPGDVEYTRTLAETLYDQAGLYDGLGQPTQAELAFRRSLRLRQELSGRAPDDMTAQRHLAKSYFGLARLLDRDSRWDDAEKLYQQAVILQEKLARDFPQSSEFRDDLGSSLYEMGYLFARTNRMPDALQVYERLAAIREELLQEFPGNALRQHRLAACLNYLGTLYRNDGRLADAERVGRRAVAVGEELAANHPDVSLYRQGMIVSYVNLGNLYVESMRLNEAEALYQSATRVAEDVSRRHAALVDYVSSLGNSCACLGRVSELRGDTAEALQRFDRAIGLLESVLHQQPRHAESKRHLTSAHAARAELFTRVGRHTESLDDWEKATAFNQDPRWTEDLRAGRALTFAHMGDWRRALADAATSSGNHSDSGIAHYRAACVQALYSAAVLADRSMLPAERKPLAQHHADRAFASLKHCCDLGFFQFPINLRRFESDPDLDPLRSRPDLQAMILDLPFPRDAFAR